MLSGRNISGRQRPLIAGLVEYWMTPEEIDRFVYNRLCTLEKANEAAGMFKDFSSPLPPRNGKFSARICSMEGGELSGASAENCQINQLASSTAGTTKSSPNQGQFPLLKPVPPTPQAEGRPPPQFFCFDVGGLDT